MEELEELNSIILTDHFQFKSVLGKGSFGLVVAAYCQNLSKTVAVKVTNHQDFTDRSQSISRRQDYEDI